MGFRGVDGNSWGLVWPRTIKTSNRLSKNDLRLASGHGVFCATLPLAPLSQFSRSDQSCRLIAEPHSQLCRTIRLGRQIDVQNLPLPKPRIVGCDDDCPDAGIIHGDGRCGRTMQKMKCHPISPDRRSSFDDDQTTSWDFRQRWQRLIWRDRVINTDGIKDNVPRGCHWLNSKRVKGAYLARTR